MEAAIAALKSAAANATDISREEILDELNKLVVSLEKPVHTLNRLTEGQLPAAICKTAVDLGLFEALSQQTDQSKSFSSEELAAKVGAAPLLTASILRYLASHGLVDEAGEDQWMANEKTRAFAQPSFQGGLCFNYAGFCRSYQTVPTFLKEHNYQDITVPTQTARNLAFNDKLSPFGWLHTEPEIMGWFMQFMSIQRQGLPDWLSIFPVEAEVDKWVSARKSAPESQDDNVLLVDIGGGFGHQAIAFRTKYPDVPGRVILQDLAPVLERVQIPQTIEKMAIDFFVNQPVKGARFYYLRNVLHDWTDEQAAVILRNLRGAMGPDSEILIDEMVIPAEKASAFSCLSDLRMSLILAAKERTMKQWQKVLDAAGLKLKNTWQYTAIPGDFILVVVPQ